ncbi:MAG: hypothetical protein JJU46_03315 [Balneolaceae bacterium]|nr:hypothetical protein [Balneolaceae bacterium]MCH8550159.1 hypothetical protein [Balneolaceae bacterium]
MSKNNKIDLTKLIPKDLLPLTETEIVAVYNSLGIDLQSREPNEDGFIVCRSPLRKDKHPSFGVHVKTGSWIDQGTGETGNIVELVKRYFNHPDQSVIEPMEQIWAIVRPYRTNTTNNGNAGFSLPTRSRSTTHSSQKDGPKQPKDFWKDEVQAKLLQAARDALEEEHPLVKMVGKYDQITFQTLIEHGCGIHQYNDEDFLLIPYFSGAQLYRRNEYTDEKVILSLPGSKVKHTIFGLEKTSGTKALHFCKSPREAMLLSQHTTDDCISICSGENTRLTDLQKKAINDIFQRGTREVLVYFDCDTDEAKRNAIDIAMSIKRMTTDIEVKLVNIHAISDGKLKDLADWFRAGKSRDELISGNHDEMQIPETEMDQARSMIFEMANKSGQSKKTEVDSGAEQAKMPSEAPTSSGAKNIDPERISKFWRGSLKSGISIHHKSFIDVLEQQGFMKIYFGDEPISIRKQDNIISSVNLSKLNDFVRDLIDQIPIELLDEDEPERMRNEIHNAYYVKASSLSGEKSQLLLRNKEIHFVTDEPNKAFLFYKNGVLEITQASAKVIPYSELDGVIWKDQIIERSIEVNEVNGAYAVFEQFVQKLGQDDPARYQAIKSSLGYLLHTYKDKANAKALILVDGKIVDSVEEAQGGTGKSLLIKATDHIRKYNYVQGKNFQPSHRFAFQGVTIGDQVVLIDDVRPGFDFEGLFNIITDDMVVEQKHKDQVQIPFRLSPKIAITTNSSVGGTGNSFKRRQNIVELPDYFGPHRTVDQEFGQTFFDDWDSEEWSRFDNFVITCLQFYLKNGLSSFEGNYAKKKMILETSAELVQFFYDEIEPGIEYFKPHLHRKFELEYLQYGDTIPQAKFTIHLKKCADLEPGIVEVVERKSGDDRFITFIGGKNKTEE